jgi:DNA-binding NarL/FixJ family response regulator
VSLQNKFRPADTLTRREIQIAKLARLSNEEIAERLGIGRQTVKNHFRAIMEKTGMGTRLELACYFCKFPNKP